MDVTDLWDFDQPRVSEQRFRAALATATGSDALVLRTQLARALGLGRRFAEASAELDHLAVDAAHMMAIVEAGEAQIPWAERALTIAGASADVEGWKPWGDARPLIDRANAVAPLKAAHDSRAYARALRWPPPYANHERYTARMLALALDRLDALIGN